MSFGEPNSPYGPPPQQQPPTPGYGYPQQPPQGYGAYPAAPPVHPGGYGHPPAGPFQMPGITRAAQIMLGIIVLAHAVIAGLYAYELTRWDETIAKANLGNDSQAEAIADLGKGIIVFFLGLAAVFALLGLALVFQYAKGGNGVRVCSIVYGSFAIVTGIFMIAAWGIGLLIIAVAILVIVFAAKRSSAEWFKRPRY